MSTPSSYKSARDEMNSGWVLPAAATFVIGGDGAVRHAFVRGDWTARAEPIDVLEVLRGIRWGSVRLCDRSRSASAAPCCSS